MKITIKDKQGKKMVFETYYHVEESGGHNKTFMCEDWILISGEGLNQWFGYNNNKTEVTNDTKRNDNNQKAVYW